MFRERLFAAAACGLFIAVLTLASAQAQAAQAAGELDPASRGPRHVAGLPHLGARDVALYRQIFALQERAEWKPPTG